MILVLTLHILYRGANIAIPDDTPKVQFSKKMIPLTYFKTISITNYKDKIILKYTDHIYDKQGHLTQALILNLFSKSIKTFKVDLCMKIVM